MQHFLDTALLTATLLRHSLTRCNTFGYSHTICNTS